MLTVNKFVRKPFFVDAVQVTEENMSEVAKWCTGHLVTTSAEDGGQAFIKVHVKRPISARQSKAFVGDWVLKAGSGYKVYNNAAFGKGFDLMPIHEAGAKEVMDDVEGAVDTILAVLDKSLGITKG